MKKKCIKTWVKSAEGLKKSEKSGKVHSIYKNVVNLFIDEQIFSIHNSKIPMTPLSIIIDDELDMKPGDVVLFVKRGFKIGNELVEYEKAKLWNPCIEKLIDFQQCRAGLEAVKASLIEYKGNTGYADSAIEPMGEKDDFLTAILRKRVWELKKNFSKESLENMNVWEPFFKENIGAGIGLTPSGDDFIIGLLFAIKCSGNNEIFEKLVETIVKNIERTNDISGAFLKCACKGEFGEKLHDLLSAIADSKKSLKYEVENIASTGHSSGVDTLNGIIIGWELLIENEKAKGKERNEIL